MTRNEQFAGANRCFFKKKLDYHHFFLKTNGLRPQTVEKCPIFSTKQENCRFAGANCWKKTILFHKKTLNLEKIIGLQVQTVE